MRNAFDPEWGGFGRAPKFPPAPAIEFLLRMWRRTGEGDPLEIATATLDGMALGGMYDVLGGGFSRYSVDEQWLVPHFEKMLYDNALLASAYLHAWVVTEQPRYREVCERTLDFMLRELLLPGGGFAAALDADTDGEEGLTYVWTPAQIRAALEPAAAERAIAYYGVTEPGNFEGANILRPSGPPPGDLEGIRLALLGARGRRPQPARDDKAIACWNGFALAALAEAGWRLGQPAYLDAARRCATFLLEAMTDDRGRLLRSARDGAGRIPAFLDDHGAVALGLLELYTATGERRWLDAAERLVASVRERFADAERGGFFYTAADGEQLIARHKELDDNPTPSGQSLMATVLLRLARLRGDERMEQEAVAVLRLAEPYLERAAPALGQLLCALEMHLSPPQEIAIVGPDDHPETPLLVAAARSGFHPNAVYAFGDGRSLRRPAAARGQVAGGRAAGRVHLRALRLPGAADRPGGRGRGAGVTVDLEPLKREAAEAAIEAEVRSGMVLGLGTGSTAAWLLEGLATAAVGRHAVGDGGRPHVGAHGAALPRAGHPADRPRAAAQPRPRDRRRRRDRARPVADQGPWRRSPAREGRGPFGRAVRCGGRRDEAGVAAGGAGAGAGRGDPVRAAAVRAPAGRRRLAAGAAWRTATAPGSPTRAT